MKKWIGRDRTLSSQNPDVFRDVWDPSIEIQEMKNNQIKAWNQK